MAILSTAAGMSAAGMVNKVVELRKLEAADAEATKTYDNSASGVNSNARSWTSFFRIPFLSSGKSESLSTSNKRSDSDNDLKELGSSSKKVIVVTDLDNGGFADITVRALSYAEVATIAKNQKGETTAKDSVSKVPVPAAKDAESEKMPLDVARALSTNSASDDKLRVILDSEYLDYQDEHDLIKPHRAAKGKKKGKKCNKKK